MNRTEKTRLIMERIQENSKKYYDGRTWEELCFDFKDIEPNQEYLWKIFNELHSDGYLYIYNSGYGKELKNHIWLLGGV